MYIYYPSNATVYVRQVGGPNAVTEQWIGSGPDSVIIISGSAPSYKAATGPGSKPSVLWSGNYLALSPTLDLTTAAWTVGAVVLSNGDGQLLGHSSNNFQVRKYRPNANNISVYNGSVDIQSSAFTTVFNNAVVCWWVYSGGSISYYENQTARGGGSWTTFSSNLDRMGSTSFGGNWAGYMSEICVWNVAFSAAQVAQLYTSYFSPRFGNVFSG